MACAIHIRTNGARYNLPDELINPHQPAHSGSGCILSHHTMFAHTYGDTIAAQCGRRIRHNPHPSVASLLD